MNDQMVHASPVCDCENCRGRGGWAHPHVRYALIAALGALALWGAVQAISGIQGFRYIGSGIAPTNTISVSGSGKVFAVPDTAVFSFSVVETGANVATAQDKVNRKTADILAYLEEAGIEERDIETAGYNAYPRYDQEECVVGQRCSQRIIGYEVSQTITVKVRDTDKAGDVLSNVGDRGVSNVSGLSFVVDDQEVLVRDAREKAIRDAKAKADTLAADLGVSIVRVVSFYDNTTPPMPYAYGKGGEASARLSADAANIPVGENEIIANVNITYEIR